MIIALQRRPEISKVFLALQIKGVDVYARDKKGWTSLHEAACIGHLEMMAWLVSNGAEINARSGSGWTALHDAAKLAHLEIVKHLISCGADRGIENDEGKTPSVVAKEWGEDEIANLTSI